MNEEQLRKEACDIAYKKAGHNAYFENGFIAGAEWEAENKLKELRDYLVSKMPSFSANEKTGTKKHAEWVGFGNAITAFDNFLINKTKNK